MFNIKNRFLKKAQFSITNPSDRAYLDWLQGQKEGKTGMSSYGYDYGKEFHSQRGQKDNFLTPNSGSQTPYNPPSESKLEQDKKDEAEALLKLPEAEDLSKTILSQRLFDYNRYAVEAEIKRLKKIQNQNSEILDMDGKKVKVKDFISKLERKVRDLENKPIFTGEYADLLNSDTMAGVGGTLELTPSEEAYRWQGPRDLAALERQIRARKENIEDLDSYIFDLVTGGEFTLFSSTIAHTNSKFIKIAEEDLLKEADEVIEDYYNELYEDSEGSPDFGTALEHPKETRNELTTKIHHHRFKKK
jgi:hypothetical protein